MTIVSAERRSAPGTKFTPHAHPALGRRLLVTGSEDGAPLLSDGSVFMNGRESEWSYEDGLAIHTTGLSRLAYLLTPKAPAAVKRDTDDDDDDADDASLLDVAAPAPDQISAGRQRAATEAAAEFASAVKVSIAAASLSAPQALTAMGPAFEARRLAARMLDGALRPHGLSEAEWIAGGSGDAVDGGAALGLAQEENRAWVSKLSAAQTFIGKRITAEKAAGRPAVAEEEHAFELAEAVRGLEAEGRLLDARRARLDA